MKNLGLEYHVEQIIQTYTTVKMKHAHCMDKMTILRLLHFIKNYSVRLLRLMDASTQHSNLKV
jgi:hypothetical protein